MNKERFCYYMMNSMQRFALRQAQPFLEKQMVECLLYGKPTTQIPPTCFEGLRITKRARA